MGTKKAAMAIIMLLGILLSVNAFAEYKDSVRQDVMKELMAFYQRNEGSRVSVDLIDGLAIHLGQIFDRNRAVPDKETKPDATKGPPAKPSK